MYDNTLPDGGEGVLIGFIAASAGDKFVRLDAEARRATVLECFATYFGRAARDALDYAESTWHADPWTRGAYSPTFGPGGLVRFGPDMRRAIGPALRQLGHRRDRPHARRRRHPLRAAGRRGDPRSGQRVLTT